MAVWINREKLSLNMNQLNETEYLEWLDDLHNNHISTRFYIENEYWITIPNGLYLTWARRLFKKGYSAKMASKMIERAYAFSIKKIK